MNGGSFSARCAGRQARACTYRGHVVGSKWGRMRPARSACCYANSARISNHGGPWEGVKRSLSHGSSLERLHGSLKGSIPADSIPSATFHRACLSKHQIAGSVHMRQVNSRIYELADHDDIDGALAGHLITNTLEADRDLRADGAQDKRLHTLYVPSEHLVQAKNFSSPNTAHQQPVLIQFATGYADEFWSYTFWPSMA